MTKARSLSRHEGANVLPLVRENEPSCLPSVDLVVGLMPGFVYVFNHDSFANDYSNRSVAEQLGYSPDEIRAFGADLFSQIVHPDDFPSLGAHMASIMALADDEEATLEYRVITKEGTLRWLRSVDAVFDRAADGRVVRHIGCASDITVEKEAEFRLLEMNASLEEKVSARTKDLATLNAELEERICARTLELQDAVDELEQLTYIATHDLKVPLNNLNRLGLMLCDAADTLTAEQAEQVRWVRECSEQLNAKVQGLVLVSQIRLGDAPPQFRLDLRAAVQSVVDVVYPTIGGNVFPIVINIENDFKVRFSGVELEAILAAVLDNSVKYAHPQRKLQINVSCGIEDGQVWLRVADNGLGIDSVRDIPTVFGLFQRGQKEPAGGGISLYCAQRMLHRCGGKITAEGTRGEWAAFTIHFPKEEVAA
ncbi:PAS domain-containing sensor histidine kinase [uncultured Sulfitobacter sp.]|uniref:sensor histidine kinase n=1 Tax=uncultured Sulfitobacter sp. TaxID=191468 RepID=UPI002626AF5F|nr:PAS domain-containing sensor histidine kinase [uncultured Sulfitobacter sp.]